MVDIDSFLEGELASINEVLEQFQTDDQKAKKRNLDEEKMLQSHGNATVSVCSSRKREEGEQNKCSSRFFRPYFHVYMLSSL